MVGKRLLLGLAAGVFALSAAVSAVATQVVVFPLRIVVLSRTYAGPPDDRLSSTINGNVTNFVLTGLDNATFSLPTAQTTTFWSLSGYDGYMTPTVASWDLTQFPYLTMWSESAGGGLTIGSEIGDYGVNYLNLFDAAPQYGPGQIFTVSTAPEPAAWTVMLIGLGGLGAALRRARTRRPLAI